MSRYDAREFETTMDGNFMPVPLGIERSNGFTIQVVWDGNPVGELGLELSCDPVDLTPNSWSNFEDMEQAVNGAGDHIWITSAVSCFWVRVKYTPTSGTGNALVRINWKGTK